MTRIVFLEVDQDDEASVRERFPEACVLAANVQDEYARAKLQGAEVVSCFIYSKFDADVIAALPAIKLLCTRSVGTDHIDLDSCNTRGITVCNVPDYGSHVIAEHVFALMLGTFRHIHAADARVESGEFDYHGLRGIALKGKTLGVVGTGKIGSAVTRIAHGFGMRILATDSVHTKELEEKYDVNYVALDELLRQSDMISLHLPATKDTNHIIDAQAFVQMKMGVTLINTARGSLIDSSALLNALRSGKVANALLDVLEHEKNFEANHDLIKCPEVVTTPHIAFYADDSIHNMYDDCFMSIGEWVDGKTPLSTVTSWERSLR